MSTSRPLLSRTSILIVGLLAQGVARFLYTVVIGRLSGPETLGEINAVLSLAVYLSLFWPAALGVAGSRFIPSATHGQQNTSATISYLKNSFWFSTLAIVPVGMVVAWWLTGDVLTAVAAGILIGTYGAYTFVRGTLLGQDRILRITVVDSISSMVALTLLVLVVTLDAPPLLLLPLSIGYLAFSVIGWPRTESRKLDGTLRRQVRSFTTSSVVWLVAAGGLLPTTMLLAQIFSTPREAGVFAAAMTLATPANMIAQALSQVLVPHIASRAHEGLRLRTAVNRLFLITSGGFVAVFAMLMLLTPWLLEFFYGAEYGDGAPIMYGLLVGVFLSSCATVPIAALMATNRQRIVSRVSVVTVVIGTGLMAFLAPTIGTLGIIIGFVTAPAISLLVLGVTISTVGKGSSRETATEEGTEQS